MCSYNIIVNFNIIKINDKTTLNISIQKEKQGILRFLVFPVNVDFRLILFQEGNYEPLLLHPNRQCQPVR